MKISHVSYKFAVLNICISCTCRTEVCWLQFMISEVTEMNDVIRCGSLQGNIMDSKIVQLINHIFEYFIFSFCKDM